MLPINPNIVEIRQHEQLRNASEQRRMQSLRDKEQYPSASNRVFAWVGSQMIDVGMRIHQRYATTNGLRAKREAFLRQIQQDSTAMRWEKKLPA